MQHALASAAAQAPPVADPAEARGTMDHRLHSRTLPMAIGYARVSTGKQRDEGGSLAVQRDRISDYCALNGLDLVAVEHDAVSGAKGEDERAGFRAALNAVRSGAAEVLVVTDVDRFSRDTDEAGHARVEVKRAGGRVVVISEQGEGVEVVAVRQLLAVLERERLRSRMRTWARARKAKGLPMGQRPFGYAKGASGLLEPDPAEQNVVRRILEERGAGLSLRRIASGLNADGIPSRDGGKWNAQTVKNVAGRG